MCKGFICSPIVILSILFIFISATFTLLEESHHIFERERYVTISIGRGGYVGHETLVSK